ncbi:hypothetical protein GBAR_LOCUS24304 [Geodia barretti]|uniref:Uncharacterized protein n=1 Tax=Geodia barretti TaxID=519541 RepID=A0AA35TA51_GEOBA|nr:hypothetical protein GBAR_LOCUS24304 [Geodia barretti]
MHWRRCERTERGAESG